MGSIGGGPITLRIIAWVALQVYSHLTKAEQTEVLHYNRSMKHV